MTKCKGCGVELQDTDSNALGYTTDINKELCMRCFKLSNYGEYQKVAFNNDNYQNIINKIPADSLVLLTTDILSLNLDYINNFKEPLLIITKRDIFPESVKEYKLINKLKEKYQNLKDIIIVCGKNNYNIDYLYNKIKELSNNKEIYLLGYTNTGKSTLINRLIKNYTDKDIRITESIHPETTLDKITIKINELTINDTPGLIDNNNIINYLSHKELKKVLPNKEINPKTCQINNKGSILIDSYVRIDYETKDKNSIVIYTSKLLNIKFISQTNNTLRNNKPYEYTLENKDIAILGLGFIKITKKIKITIYTLNNIKPLIRDNLI